MSALAFHPVADVFPPMVGQEFVRLVNDIRVYGLREKIVLDRDGRILDGRNRIRACEKAGVTPEFREYTGDDPIAFIISANLHRRHLSESQRAMVAASLATMKSGARTDLAPIGGRSQPAAAKLLNVSTRSVQRARTVLREAKPEDIAAAIERGETTVNAVLKGLPPVVDPPSTVRADEGVAVLGNETLVVWGDTKIRVHQSVDSEFRRIEEGLRALLSTDPAVLRANLGVVAIRARKAKLELSAVVALATPPKDKTGWLLFDDADEDAGGEAGAR